MGLVGEAEIVKPGTGGDEEFSLVHGGPLYQLLLRSRLIRPPFGNLFARIAVITAIAWLPLVPLTILSGTFVAGVNVPFFYDLEVQVRLLFALPLLILAEQIVYIRMRALVSQFLERQIITEKVQPAFSAIIASSMRLRNSMSIEIALLLFAVLAGPRVWRAALALHSSTWYASVAATSFSYSAAGEWYAFISVPVFQFILLRWYFRIFIWCRLLFQVSRLELNLVALHPDRCCGLGFLGTVASAFAPLLMAHSGLVAGFIGNRILHEGASLPQYRFELVGMACILMVIALGPICVFVPKLHDAKLAGLRTYGRLASDYVVGFAWKWSGGSVTGAEPLLGSADIQSLADLANSFAIVKEVKVVPFGKESVVRFLVIIAVPLAPLALTMFSLEELLKRLVKIIL
jgi:hypothetical protein